MYPDFFDKVKPIKLIDELSIVLGACDDGIFEFSFLDVVKTAGHSCPTIAGAYLATQTALDALYENEIPKRGQVKVLIRDEENAGVTAIIGNTISQITGACDENGFKGLFGNFSRDNLLSFGEDIKGDIKFVRIDNGKSVEITYTPNNVPQKKEQQELMQKLSSNQARQDEKEKFGKLWQKRVCEIFENKSKVIKIIN